MITILAVIKDPAQAYMYEHLSRLSGAQLLHAEGALHALTQIERSDINAIICESDMGDMSGEELQGVIHEEFKTRGVPVFILPSANDLSSKGGLGTPAMCGPQLLSTVLSVFGASLSEYPVPMNPNISAQLEGNLGQFTLSEMLGWVSEMRFDGHWIITVKDKGGAERSAHLAMREGNIQYVEFSGLMGRAALFALTKSVSQFGNARFRFFKTPPLKLPAPSADLSKGTARLLIEIAVDLDHSGTSSSHN